MKNFKLPDFDYGKYYPMYVKGRQRYATATDVSFINDNLILVAVFFGKKIYLIDISDGGYNILDEINTPAFPDIMDYKDGLIITSNYPSAGTINGSVSVFNLVDNKIIFKKEIELVGLKTHGCTIINESEVIVTSTYSDKRGIYFLNLNTEKYTVFNDFKYYPKDVFLTNNKLLIVTSLGHPSNKIEEADDSILYLYDYPSMNKIDELPFKGLTDAVCVNNENGFITLQDQDKLLHFSLINDKLNYLGLISGFNFPHGVDSLNDKIIVTNYGDNSITLFNLSEI